MSNKKSSNRSKKFPPPPLHLPIPNSTIIDDKCSNEQYKSTVTCSSSSSSSLKKCSHQQTSFILPVNQRSQILQTLIDSSSTLLFQSASETKHKRSHISLNTTQINFLKRQYASRQTPVNENEWIDLVRFILYKPIEHDLITLLDKYKTTYFDRVNSPNTPDETIRACLCDMVSQILLTYTSNPSQHSSSTNHSKRKRTDHIENSNKSPKIEINTETKFVIAYLNHDQFIQTTNHHLFKYIPDKIAEEYLRKQGHLKDLMSDKKIYLMFYDEILHLMNEQNIELSEISIDHSFTLPQSILTHIHAFNTVDID